MKSVSSTDRLTEDHDEIHSPSQCADSHYELNEEDEEGERSQRTLSFLHNLHAPRNSVCGTRNSITSLKSNDIARKTSKLTENPKLFANTLSERLNVPWIEHTFEMRECIKFIAEEGNSEKCGCGAFLSGHSHLAQSRFYVYNDANKDDDERWTISRHTQTAPTNAFGTLVFQGGTHSHKAHYVRLAYDSDPNDILYLMEHVWGLSPPRLVITVHGGMSNFEVQAKLGQLFREGILKAAQTTGAWIITSGLDSGVVRQVALAMDEAGISARMRSKITTIGIAPWGVIKRKERMLGHDISVMYDVEAFGSGVGILNDRHSFFLLADNGTQRRYGADIHLRQNLENYLATQGIRGRKVPVVCTVMEGGATTLKAVYEYVVEDPLIPTIVCDGSGRAADILSFAVRYINSDGTFAIEVEEQLNSLIKMVFPLKNARKIYNMVTKCAARNDLLRIYRYGEDTREQVDNVILTAVLEKQNLSPPEQLALTLSWNRVDVARRSLFSHGRRWPQHILHSAMKEALRLNRVEFVECLLENGVNMKYFLTLQTLEQLYNMDDNTEHSVRFMFEGTEKASEPLTLSDIGQIVERLMGNGYKHYYTSREFKINCQLNRRSKTERTYLIKSINKSIEKQRTSLSLAPMMDNEDDHTDFQYPFNDLLLWAVLTRRPDMARCMWMHEKDAMAKSLVAIRLYKAVAKIAEHDYLQVEIANKLREHAIRFREDAIALLDYCYREDKEQTLKLLTADLPHWGNHNCLSLAVLANTKTFLAHPCNQMLLAELWHGSLRVRSGSNLRVIMGLVFPFLTLMLAYKPPRYARTNDDEEEEENDKRVSSMYGPQFHSFQYGKGKGSSISVLSKRMFVGRQTKYKPRESTDEDLSELLGAGDGLGKKVTILTSKRSSTAGSAEASLSDIVEEPTLSKFEKLQAFYSAPVTKFWSWCIAFHLFLGVSTYVLLIETPVDPTREEWFTLVYVVVMLLEHVRKVLVHSVFRYYNLLTLVAALTFLVGFGFRLSPSLRHSYGRVILSFSNVLWYMKVFEYLSVHPLLGPYIQMASKMVVSMNYIIVLLLVTLMAFGVSRQAITFPHEKWNWLLVRNIFYKPYFMLYGEVYAGEIDTCGDDGTNCVPGGWIPPILMTIFLLVANILLINMLIAIFNNIFNETNVRSQEVWLFQRYAQLNEYHDTSLLPPPFTILAHIANLLIMCCKKRSTNTNKRQPDFSLKLHLSEEELAVLYDFEEDCMDELTRKRLKEEKGKEEERWRKTVELTDLTAQRVNELLQENFVLRSRLGDMEVKLDNMAHSHYRLFETVKSRKKLYHESTHSLPETKDIPLMLNIEPCESVNVVNDNLLNVIDDRKLAPSPLLTHLRRDQTLRKYEEANYQAMSHVTSRNRLNSSSLSLSQDMRDMNRIATPVMTKTTLRDDDDSSEVEEQPSELDEEEE
ncbi:hypothetical protein WR25_04380 [Diploscapter pachys]|uniref:TRPM SLOG domain-containing protein n=1 Tax=Diploscapter pachys TaxID=2018661 RepID=A0A2A2JGX9_9BILA|nr:hypothetical protein WR25_04380 [Diploscapter pachys]